METFESIFGRMVRERAAAPPVLAPGECRSASLRVCTLCHASAIDYAAEADVRDAALQEFWRSLRLTTRLAPLVRSPLGRGYRTTSKRKAFERGHELRLALIDPSQAGSPRTMDVTACVIEPAAHAAIFARIQESLLKPFARPLTKALRYVIIKGNYDEFSVILTVATVDGPLVKAANTLSKGLTRLCPPVTGIFLFEDQSDGRYYLGTRNPSARGGLRTLFGTGKVFQKFGGRSFLFSALAFSQVNGSLVDEVIATTERLIGLTPGVTLYDLYCGYGLFTLTLGASAGAAIGIERSPESIDAARANATRQSAGHIRFVRSDITAESLAPVIARARPGDAFLLDPPRGGTAAGVIECVAARKPGRVAHLFCDCDRMPGEIERWRTAGYRVAHAVPFDMFPGTDDAEVLVIFDRR